MRATMTDQILAMQRENLRVAANLLAGEVEGVSFQENKSGGISRLTVTMWPALASKSEPDHSFIDYIGKLTRQTATIFAYDPAQNDFVRRTTNIIKPDGQRAVGTVLGSASAAYAPIQSGKPYLGTAVILGTSYQTLYLPIFSSSASVPKNAAGVAGILYVGVRDTGLSARYNETAIGLVLMNAVLILLATLAACAISYVLLRPLGTAADQITALSNGEVVDITVNRQDEVGRMQAALGKLAVTAERAFRQAQMIEQSSQAVLTASADDELRIDYMNPSAGKVFADLRRQDPKLPAEIRGARLSAVHPRGAEIERIARDPRQLPHVEQFRIGEEVAIFRLSALTNRDGTYAGPKLTVIPATQQERTATQFETDVASLLRNVEESLDTLKARTAALEEAANSGTLDSGEAAQVATQTSEAVQTVASAVEELNGSFAEVAERISVNAAMAREAASATEGASASARALEEAGQRISDVVSLIADVAAQTNLLALNATIEASRAGEAGKGFAVVASEVKNLAERAANATTEISTEVARVNAAGHSLLKAVENVQVAIRNVDEVSTAVAAAVNEQQVTTDEIARTVHNVAESASRVQRLSQNVNTASGKTGEAAGEVSRVTDDLDRAGRELGTRAQSFLSFVRKAA
nr:methyl-accepting chemotaxis protein [Acuticoccus mangrovi]